jgi:hypothetical protein
MPQVRSIDISEFYSGVRWWCTNTRWPRDFHNAQYKALAAQNPNGQFSTAWWSAFLPRLSSWRALRPVSKAEITRLLAANRDYLITTWRQVCVPLRDFDITDVTWNRVHAFPDVVARLKPTSSAVFRSKFCHFLLPQVFPVFDNLAVGGSLTYQEYFQQVKGTWEATPLSQRAQMIHELTQQISNRGFLHSRYPFATKITELALIGRRQLKRR